MADFVDAYDTTTGDKLAHQVPAHFIEQGLFPTLAATPQAAGRAARKQKAAPSAEPDADTNGKDAD